MPKLKASPLETETVMSGLDLAKTFNAELVISVLFLSKDLFNF